MNGSHSAEPTTRDAIRLEQRLYGTAEVCRLLDISKRTFWKYVADGTLRAKKQGRKVYVSATALDEYIGNLPDARHEVAA